MLRRQLGRIIAATIVVYWLKPQRGYHQLVNTRLGQFPQHSGCELTPMQPQVMTRWDEGATAMILLVILALAGALSGSVSGALWSGSDGILLGAITGMFLGACVWLLTGSFMRVLHEYRLSRYFRKDSAEDQ
jgi:hypothetical protein